MSWPAGEQDKEKRRDIARLISKKEFWRAVYLESFRQSHNLGTASREADTALLAFERKFLEDES